jgi:hypothetical protein
MKRKIVGFLVCTLFLMQIIPISMGVANDVENTLNVSEPEFEVGLYPGVYSGVFNNFLPLPFGSLRISVKNIGDETAHNVTLINLSIDENVLYNSRVTEWKKDIEPGQTIKQNPSGMFVGFGRFNATMTVTCDEGVIGTGSSSGFIFGIVIFVP